MSREEVDFLFVCITSLFTLEMATDLVGPVIAMLVFELKNHLVFVSFPTICSCSICYSSNPSCSVKSDRSDDNSQMIQFIFDRGSLFDINGVLCIVITFFHSF